MGYKHAHWRWSNILVLAILLTMPVVMYAMEQEEEVRINGMNLIEASRDGYKEIVDSLIKAGTDINAVNNDGYSALMGASGNGYKEVVDSLIKKGADINAVSNNGWAALRWASGNGRKEIVDSLIKGGADINAVSNNGTTALMSASWTGYKEVVDSLIKAEADINAVDNDGNTALMEASKYGYKEIMDSLIKGGANPYIKNKKRKNSLDIAGNNEEKLKKHIIKKRKKYVIKKYKEYLIDGKSRMEDLAASLQKEYDWYNPYWDDDKGNHDEHDLKEIKQSYSFPKDLAGVITRMRYDISDDEWAQMLQLQNKQQ